MEADATVIRPDMAGGEWLELLACTKQGPTHESVLVVKARPSHLHLALLTLGLEPGTPLTWRVDTDGDGIEHPVSGPRIAITVSYERDGRTIREPASRWVLDRATRKPLPDNIWHFAGSRFREHEDRTVYLADLSGAVISLVNFGDEVLARRTELTNRNDEQAWVVAADHVPAAGTRVTIRFQALREPPPVPPQAAPETPAPAPPEAAPEPADDGGGTEQAP